jgi:dihydroorotase
MNWDDKCKPESGNYKIKNNLYLRPLMKLLIKQASIVDPNSPFNGQTTDIFIADGVITRIGNNITEKANQEIAVPGLCVSPGWVDIFANFADPGFEYKETLETGAAAAAAGGFTDVLVTPNTSPVLHNKAAVEYVTQKGKHLPVTIHPIGAITRQTEGKELAEMYDMHNSGAMAFSDGTHPVQSAGLLVKALQYVKAFDGVIIQIPDDTSINAHGLMNEGIASTQLGLPGKPAMAEELMVARDIKLCRYADSKLHFTGVTTPKSLEYIKRGKEGGTGVSCSVTPLHLLYCDEDLARYNTNLKLNPPLRTSAYRDALQKAVADGTVDCIASHHQPHEYDSKVVEFEYARYGSIGIETAYAALNTAVQGITNARCVELLSTNARKLFGLPSANIAEGNEAVLTLFLPSDRWTVNIEASKSKSRNSPLHGRELTGKIYGIVNGKKSIVTSA